jgi:hypothetical protein
MTKRQHHGRRIVPPAESRASFRRALSPPRSRRVSEIHASRPARCHRTVTGPALKESLAAAGALLTASPAMKRITFITAITALALWNAGADEKSADGWISLFDGKTLNGWKSNEEVPNVFSVKNGALVVKGGRAHIFYAGEVKGAKFKNFEFKAKVLTKKNANSGIYFHTEFQEKDWPKKGYECQVNNSFDKDPRRTGSLYAVADFKETPFKDDEWMDYHIKVSGKQITITVNGKVTADYTEKETDARGDANQKKGRWLSEGTFAFQAHDPGCEVHYKDIMVKPLD